MDADKNSVTYAIVLKPDPKDYFCVRRFEVGRLLSIHGDVVEMSLPQRRCVLHKSYVYCLNGEDRQFVNAFPRIEKARKAFQNALKSEPKCYLNECARLLSGLGLDLAGKCEAASKEIVKCCTIVDECLSEIERSGQIHYKNCEKYFVVHIDEVQRKLVQNILRNIEM